MLLKLEIKRAMKNLPQLILGVAIITLAVVVIMVFCAYSGNSQTTTAKSSIALVTNNNTLIESVGMDVLGNMESAKNLFDLSVLEEDEAVKAFNDGNLLGVVIFPNNYIESISRGENEPAHVMLKNDGISFSLNLIAELCGAASNLLAATEAQSYAAADLCNEYGPVEDKSQIIDDMDVNCARVILEREDNFNKVTIYGEGDVSVAQGYACSAVVILVLLWGVSCGSVLKSDSPVLVKKLSANLISVEKQQIFKLIALICLIGSMFLLLGMALLLTFPFAKELYEIVDIKTIWQLVLMLLAFIPAVILSAAIVIFSFTAASNQIGGIILLFIETIIMSYMSGCLMPSVYLPDTVETAGKVLPAYFMQKQATNALSGFVDLKNTIIILVYAVVFTVISCIIMEIRSRRT
jgi:hypothetical protein